MTGIGIHVETCANSKTPGRRVRPPVPRRSRNLAVSQRSLTRSRMVQGLVFTLGKIFTFSHDAELLRFPTFPKEDELLGGGVAFGPSRPHIYCCHYLSLYSMNSSRSFSSCTRFCPSWTPLNVIHWDPAGVLFIEKLLQMFLDILQVHVSAACPNSQHSNHPAG